MGKMGRIYTMDVTTLDEDDREMRSLQIEGNRKRAERARQAAMSMDPGIDLATNISDLLGNLLHTCDVEGLNFKELLGSGEYHYEAETGDDPDEWMG
jgi:hypothetical protein